MSSYYETIGAYTRLTGTWLRHRAPRLPLLALRQLWRPATIACVYAGIGIFTFGQCGAHGYRDVAALKLKQAELCSTPDDRIARDDFCYQSFDYDFPPIGMRAFMAGVFWPLYWSWELQQ